LSRKLSSRLDLELAVSNHMGRQLGAHSLLFHQAVAERLGLNATDLKCLDLARAEQDITAGRIAELTGLTTAAVTSVIDRLEKSGIVRRERDSVDRRKVFVRPIPERAAEIAALFESLNGAMRELYARYTLDDLTLLRDFAVAADEIMLAETKKLRGLGLI
jgi:DNA-binding MarR family transcriptional regulator